MIRKAVTLAALTLAAFAGSLQGAVAAPNIVRGCVLKPTANGTLMPLCVQDPGASR